MRSLKDMLLENYHKPSRENMILVEVKGTKWVFRNTNLGMYQIILNENHINSVSVNENAVSDLKFWLDNKVTNRLLFESFSDDINSTINKNLYCTSIRAIDPIDETLKNWAGVNITAKSFEEADKYCRENLGYCKVDGQLVAEIPCVEDTHYPDWSKMIEYK